jgi:hypothetical protein
MLHLVNKAGIAGAIQRLRIFSGSQLLCDIDNYGTLVSLLTPHQSQSKTTLQVRDQVLQGTGLKVTGYELMTGLGANTNNADFDICFPSLKSVLTLTDNYVPYVCNGWNWSLYEWSFSSCKPLDQFIDFYYGNC